MIRIGSMLACALFGLSLTSVAAQESPQPYSHIRSVDARLQYAIADADARSPTFHDLVKRLSATNVIVYVVHDAAPHPRAAGHLSFISGAGGRRYVHVGIVQRYTGCELQAILGHELRHAVEIAEHLDVVDDASVAALYERIGFGGHSPGRRWFETEAAIEAGRRVQRELLAAPTATSGR